MKTSTFKKPKLKTVICSGLIFLGLATTASALTKAEKVSACLDSPLSDDEEKTLLTDIDSWVNIYADSVRLNSAACYTKLTGEPAKFVNGIGIVSGETTLEDMLKDKESIENERLAREAIAKAERLKKEAERVALEKSKIQLEAEMKKLQKQVSCVSVRTLIIGTELEAISERFQQSNQLLILNDTHSACTELYSNEKSEAMLNLTCVDVFERMGHPDLAFSESEIKATLSAEIIDLINLQANLEKDLLDTKTKILEAKGIVKDKTFNQKLADGLAAKSCAEFGYEGVYLD